MTEKKDDKQTPAPKVAEVAEDVEGAQKALRSQGRRIGALEERLDALEQKLTAWAGLPAD